MRRGYAWPYPFSQAPSHPAIPCNTCSCAHPADLLPCAHPAPCGERLLLPSATRRPAATCNLPRCCKALTPFSAAIAPSWLTLLSTHTPGYLLRTLKIKQASAGRSAPGKSQAPTRSLFQAAILARRSALDSRLLRSLRAAVPVRVPAAHKSCSVHSHIMSHNAFPLCQDKHA